ncbi:kinase-like protein [Gigaspora margarita]|uniref:Kinase-like protein n=1 Tax=Gigaspora margarita TaxID=4874 RepID=A0A8H4AVW8_GIGMA|nr:kinase-like protein [Gigaspora margarita]
MSSNSLNEILSDQLQRIKTCLKENNIEELDYSQFSDHKIVGTGGSAIVCSAIAQKKIYALKILNVNQCLPEKNFLKLLRELEILSNIHHSNIRHPNIIELYGVLIDPSGNPIMVLQFANGGSLREHLHAKQNDGLYKISWTELIQIANDIAKGLKHLHSNGIIHRYLHSKNILLNDGRALISDFGISREFKEFSNTSSSSKMQGMITYTDPQYLLHGKKFKRNEKSDIYSLGMLLWELTSGIPPFHNLTIVEIVLKIKYHCVENVINNTPQDYANLYKKCWSSDPEQRPTPNEISAVLDTLFGEITVEFITNCIGNTLCDTSSDTTATFSEVSNCGTATLSKIPNYRALLLLFSSTWKNNKVPTVGEIAYKLQELLTFGFKPTYSAIIDILQVFKYKLSYIGEKIISAFFIFCENERRDEFYKQIVIETIKAERSIKMFEVWNFLDEKFGSKSATIFICAMKQFKERNLSCAINGIKAFNTIEHYSRSTFNAFDYKPLLFSRPFYTWILIKFTEDSEIAYFAFNDILETRISFDLNTVSCRIFKTKFNESCNIFKIYCNVKNFFQISHLELLKKVSDKDILCSLFEFYLPKLFGLPTNFRMPIQGTDDSNIDFKPKKKMKKRTGDEKLEWLTAIKDIHNGIVEEDDTKTSAIFRNCINVLYHKLEEEGKL